jgi:hypothetical protein
VASDLGFLFNLERGGWADHEGWAGGFAGRFGAVELIEEDCPLSRVTLYDGREVWVVTGRDAASELLVDQRLSSDRLNPGFPITTPRLAGMRNPAASHWWATTIPSTTPSAGW